MSIENKDLPEPPKPSKQKLSFNETKIERFVDFQAVIADKSASAISRQIARDISADTYTCAGKVLDRLAPIDLIVMVNAWQDCLDLSRQESIPVPMMPWYNNLRLISNMIIQAENSSIEDEGYNEAMQVSALVLFLTIFLYRNRKMIEIKDIRKISLSRSGLETIDLDNIVALEPIAEAPLATWKKTVKSMPPVIKALDSVNQGGTPEERIERVKEMIEKLGPEVSLSYMNEGGMARFDPPAEPPTGGVKGLEDTLKALIAKKNGPPPEGR